MNTKISLLKIASFVLLCFTASTVLAREFILKNDSMFDIYCRCRSNAEAQANQQFNCMNYTIKAGESRTYSMDRNYSIMTAGTSNLPTAYYYDVPIRELLNESAKNDPKHMELSRTSTPICYVNSGIPYGWSFTLAWQQKK